MSIKEQLESHPYIAIAGSVVTIVTIIASVLGWLYQDRINSIAAKYEAEKAVLIKKHEDEIHELKDKAGMKQGASSPATGSINLLVDSKPKLSPSLSPSVGKCQDVFLPGNPYPIGFEQAKIGVKLSVIKAFSKFSSGKLDSSSYDVNLSEDLFSSIEFSHDSEGSDPKIDGVTFSFRGDVAHTCVKDKALVAFDGSRSLMQIFGEDIAWKNVKGYRVSISQYRYSIRKPF